MMRAAAAHAARSGARDDDSPFDNLDVEGVESKRRQAYDSASRDFVAPVTATTRDDRTRDASFRETRPAPKAPGLDRMDNAVDLEDRDGVVSVSDSYSPCRTKLIRASGLNERGHFFRQHSPPKPSRRSESGQTV